MSLTLVTAGTEPLTLEQAKQHIRMDSDAEDETIQRYIEAARSYVEGQTRRCMTAKTYDYKIDYDWPYKYGAHRITLPINPLVSVTSISYVDSNGDSQTLAGSQYVVSAREFSSFIAPAYEVTWPSVRYIPSAITVRFVCGSNSNIPSELVQAVALLVANMDMYREPVAAKALAANPYGVEAMISPYRSSTFV